MNVFETMGHAVGVPSVVLAAVTAGLLLMLGGVVIRRQIAAAGGGVIPDEGFSLRNAVELLLEMLVGLAKQTIGPEYRSYMPLIGTLFVFILVANLMGLVPGLEGATTSPNVTFAWAIISFLVYNAVGIRRHGFWYINQFLGPSFFDVSIGGKKIHVRLLAPFFLPLELVLHFARILTLGVRLLANMSADHVVVAVWLGLLPPLVPAIFMGLGVMIAFLQAFVFSLLTMIYIGMALEEAH